jgi:hypothetical protein
MISLVRIRPRMGASARWAGRVGLQIVADSAVAAGGKPHGNDAPQRRAGHTPLYFPVNFAPRAPQLPNGRRSAAFRCKEQCKYNGGIGAAAPPATCVFLQAIELLSENINDAAACSAA